jgi:hypothetical protein
MRGVALITRGGRGIGSGMSKSLASVNGGFEDLPMLEEMT